MTIRASALIFAAVLLASPSLAIAKPENKGKSDHAGHGQQQVGHGAAHGSSHAKHANRAPGLACPPGLAKKAPACIPPGQWRKGDRLPESWATRYSRYDSLPDFYRSRYPANAGYRYVVNEGRVYVINAATRAILDVVLR